MNYQKFVQAAFRYTDWISPSIWRMFWIPQPTHNPPPPRVHHLSQSWLILGYLCVSTGSFVYAIFYFFCFLLPSCLEKLLEWCLMDRKGPSPQYCTSVCFYILRTACHCHVLFTVGFVFAHYTNLCFDTVTLKKSKLYKVSDMKRKKNGCYISFCIPVNVFCSKGFCLLMWIIQWAVPYVLRVFLGGWGGVSIDVYLLISEGKMMWYCLY